VTQDTEFKVVWMSSRLGELSQICETSKGALFVAIARTRSPEVSTVRIEDALGKVILDDQAIRREALHASNDE
jgi:hypothetical protein